MQLIDLLELKYLLKKYSEPHRHYHTFAHIKDCINKLRSVDGLNEDEKNILRTAIMFHDAIYDPKASDNEERSADMADEYLTKQNVLLQDRAEINRLILLTKGHTVEPGDKLGAIMISIDLSILGSSPKRYDRYAENIRKEYEFVPMNLYVEGRTKILQKFLDSEYIFADENFRAKYEKKARANLRREIRDLAHK